tara:strand:- start:282 stop:833 length:552 start_codon:yes stop_codon:yes gene_type:complete
MWKYKNTPLTIGKSWTTEEGVVFPAVWARMTQEEKIAAGLTWEDDPVIATFDPRFYYSSTNPKNLEDQSQIDSEGNPVLDGDGNQVVVIGLKNIWLKHTKDRAKNLLLDTDWYIIRSIETSKAVPENITEYRNAVKTACDNIENKINQAGSLEDFTKLFDRVKDENDVVGPAPIDNWPKLDNE